MGDISYALETYKRLGENAMRASEVLGLDHHTVLKIVKALGEYAHHDNPWQKRRVNMLSVDGEYIRTFASTRDAGRFIANKFNLNSENIGGYASHIVDVCSGKRKSCHGYKWQYTN